MHAQPHSSESVQRCLRDPRWGTTVRAVLLARWLRLRREEAGVTPAEAARHIRGSVSKISRMETASSPLKERDVADLLRLYGAPETECAEALLMVRLVNEPGWWQRYNSTALPQWLQTLVGLERDARLIRTYEVQFVPGLLQTRAYADAVVRSGDGLLPGEGVRHRVELRLARQEMFRGVRPPVLWAVIDEAVLMRPVGGKDVMREQLEHLLAATDRPGVHIQVAPFEAVAQIALGVPVTLLRFDSPALPDIVYLEHMTDAVYLDKDSDVETYRSVLDRLGTLALPPARSRKAIRDALDRHR
ncbi:transcriptional regulator [Streptomyces mashuensis]|uniref:Transcriptional regulator n=1 Tax=Streptomyces mashuensis TaxID=33904 RepID=A0A919EEW4_9ACTN|nr:helix-turn-helix transcriptional regulator [Streptomyces mashuensis]GHF67776.1 transcriptional regulator [Streptomyces mashuensis]